MAMKTEVNLTEGYRYLFSDQDWKVAIFLVDVCAEGDKPHEEDAQGKAPQDELPVAKVIDKAASILQQLQQPHLHWHHQIICSTLKSQA